MNDVNCYFIVILLFRYVYYTIIIYTILIGISIDYHARCKVLGHIICCTAYFAAIVCKCKRCYCGVVSMVDMSLILYRGIIEGTGQYIKLLGAYVSLLLEFW